MSLELKRFSRSELEVAVSDASMSGRVYAKNGEKEMPGEFYLATLEHALQAVKYYRAERRTATRRGEVGGRS